MPAAMKRNKFRDINPITSSNKRPQGQEAGAFVIFLILAFLALVVLYFMQFVDELVLLIGVLVILAVLYYKSPGMIIELPEYRRAVILRYGKFHRVAGPGWVFLIPFIDDPRVVDLRVFTANIEPQKVITKDNIVLTVDAISFLKITDPKAAVINVEDPALSVKAYVEAHLRDIVGKMELESVISQVDMINRLLQKGLEQISKDWGISVVKVEIQSIELPSEVMDAMHRRKAAEQQKYAAEELAKAQAIRIDAVRDAAGKLTDPALQYLYLQALEKISEGRSSKIIFPIELTHLAERLSGRMGSTSKTTEDELREKYNELLLERAREGKRAKKEDIIEELRKRTRKDKK
ncbi:MAG: hypothetical protein J7L23_01360 [Candidatus Diapherotrites archaeon]|nr:hypothetical protein [Candidatus Diapherotrites archaeon]